MFQSAIAGAERVFEIMDETPDLVDQDDARVIHSLKGDVEFSHVHFSYEDGKPILKDINFKARSGRENCFGRSNWFRKNDNHQFVNEIL